MEARDVFWAAAVSSVSDWGRGLLGSGVPGRLSRTAR
jgi:hypothetical protein